MPQIDNIGIITTQGQELMRVTGLSNGLLYCVPMQGPMTVKVCLPDQFWVLLDRMP